jgi:uncharacterized membrane protein
LKLSRKGKEIVNDQILVSGATHMYYALLTAGITLSLIGLADSIYFILAQYVSRGQKTCDLLLDTPCARLFGIPNSVIGLIFYSGIAAACAVSWLTGQRSLLPYALAAAVVALCVSLYLAYALLFKLRRVCRLCFLAHAINALLVVVLAALVLR